MLIKTIGWIYTQVAKLGMGDIDDNEASTATQWIVHLKDQKLYIKVRRDRTYHPLQEGTT